jgi:hypothetical protein
LLATIKTNTTTTVANMTAFKYVHIQMVMSGIVVRNELIPYSVFALGHTNQLNTYYSAYTYGNITRASDTTITTTSMASGIAFSIYGIK